MKKRLLTLFVAIMLLVSVMGCSKGEVETNNEKDKKNVVDMSGNEVECPDVVERYAVAWAGLTDILFMLDHAEHMVAYPEKSASFKWSYEKYPRLEEMVCLANEGISVEEVLETEAQVVFLKAADDMDLYNKLKKVELLWWIVSLIPMMIY